MPRPRRCARAICWSLRQRCSAHQEKVQQGQSHIHLPLLARRISHDSRRRGGGDRRVHNILIGCYRTRSWLRHLATARRGLRERQESLTKPSWWEKILETPAFWASAFAKWACGAAGSALPWHGRGRRFDPGQVHHKINNLQEPPFSDW